MTEPSEVEVPRLDEIKKDVADALKKVWEDKGVEILKTHDVQIVARPSVVNPADGGGVTFDIKIKGIID